MKPLYAMASQPHYAAHLAPIWLALDPAERGQFVVTGRAAHAEALRLGVPPGELHRRPTAPPSRRGTDAGVWMVAGWPDLDRLGPRRRIVFVEHGTGQTYQGNAFPAHYPGGPRRERVAVFLCPNERVAALNRQAYPRAVVEVTGCAHTERLAAYRRAHHPYRAAQPVATFHFDASSKVAPEATSAWSHYLPGLPKVVQRTNLAGHAHPRSWANRAPQWEAMGATTFEHQDEALAVASVLVADNTSCLYQAAALGIPVVVLNAPWYRRDVQHGLRFWSHACVGVQVDGPADLTQAIAWSLKDDPLAEHREAIAAELYPALDGAAAAAVGVLREVLA